MSRHLEPIRSQTAQPATSERPQPNSAEHERLIVVDASSTHQVTTRERLISAGLPEYAIDNRLGGMLHAFGPGIYIVGDREHRESLLYAALAHTPDGAGARRTAGALLGLPVGTPKTIDLLVPHGRRRTLASPIQVRQTRLAFDTVTVDGLRLTTVPRTVCDLATELGPKEIRHLAEWCLVHRKMSESQFRRELRRFISRGRPGSGIVRLLDLQVLSTDAIPASDLEKLGVHLLDDAHIEGYQLHFTPPWSDGVSGIVDIGIPDVNVILEFDGRPWHVTTRDTRKDKQRDRTAAAHGWLPLRYTGDEVREEPERVKAEIRWFVDSRRKQRRSTNWSA